MPALAQRKGIWPLKSVSGAADRMEDVMTRIFILAAIASGALVSCAHAPANGPYRPETKPEKKEFAFDRLDIYPDDVRANLTAYTNMPVAWAGVILSSDARDDDNGLTIGVDSTFEHHYFDWVQENGGKDLKLSLSPRGEGSFHVKWHMNKLKTDASFPNAQKYAKRGKLAIVYGTPLKLDDNGAVVLKYRYLRILDQDHFTTNQFDYGRLGEPFRVMHPEGKTNKVASASAR
jgi:hypothetical protein